MTQRTSQQNKSIHLGCTMIADTLNDAGLDMKKVLKPEINIPWTTESVKEYIFRPIMKAMYQKQSTTELDKVQEIDKIWETIMRFLMEKHHIDYVPFPHDAEKLTENLAPKKHIEIEYDDNCPTPLV